MSDIRFNQWLHQSGTGGVSQDHIGNIGIGTTNPSIVVSAANTAVLNVGVITANNLFVNNAFNGDITGNVTGNISGATGTFSGNVDIADKIIHTGDTDTAMRFPADNTFAVDTAGSERFRITSAGLIGIGTVSPSGPIHAHVASGTQRSYFEASAAHSFLRLKSGSTSYNSGLEFFSGASNIANVNGLGAGGLQFEVNGSERLRITSGGLVGVNCTPLAQFQVKAGTDQNIALSSMSSEAAIEAYNDAGSANVSLRLRGSDFKFFTTSTERLRIDSSGRLLVNHTADVAPDGYESLIQTSGTDYRGGSISIRRDQNNSSGPALLLTKSRSGSIGGNTIVQDNDGLGTIWFYGADGNDVSQAGARIECNVDATPGSNDMPGRLSFYVTSDGAASPVERMRINRKGFLKMGPRITDGSHGAADLDSVRHEFTSDNNGWVLYVQHTSGAASESEGILISYRSTTPNGTGNSFIQGNDSNATRFRFASNGGLYNYSGNNSNLSDEREKKNIVSLDNKWDKVKSWELKKFHYNEDADSDDLRYGVIAQQVEEHCPEVVSDWVKQKAESAVLDEDGNVVTPAQAEVVRKGVKEQQMMWMAIKALQEAQTRIETLETQNTAQQTQINDLITRVTALEG